MDLRVGQVRAAAEGGAVIRRAVGGTAVMRAQLARITELAALPHVSVQVLPFSAGVHPAMEGPFRILGFPGPDDPDVVYLENQAGSGRGVPRRDQGKSPAIQAPGQARTGHRGR